MSKISAKNIQLCDSGSSSKFLFFSDKIFGMLETVEQFVKTSYSLFGNIFQWRLIPQRNQLICIANQLADFYMVWVFTERYSQTDFDYTLITQATFKRSDNPFSYDENHIRFKYEKGTGEMFFLVIIIESLS